MNTQKNPIKKQLKKDYDELVLARKYCQKIMKTLDENCLARVEIGFLITDMPDFIFLKHQADLIRGTLRKVCSTEISISQAHEIIQTIYLQIVETIGIFNSRKFD